MVDKDQELVEKARTEYGIVNADKLPPSQLKAELKAIDDQAKVEEQSEPKEAKKVSTKETK